jgi:poly(A) polymerase
LYRQANAVGTQEYIAPIKTTPTVISRSEHCISRAGINENALKVLYRLKDTGFKAYLVGGGVRDLLLGREPKDFDVVTDARPEQIRKVFRNCRLIGRRFRLAHVYFKRDVVEVATFRALLEPDATPDEDAEVQDGRIIRDNVYGTIEEDALRRDFTVNSLYYDIRNFSVLDYTGAIQDLQTGTLRFIGDPETRYREDPVRMLRAVRFAAKLGFRIHPETPMFKLGHLLHDVPPARLFDEVLKLFHGGCALQTFELLRRYGLFSWLFPATERALAQEEQGFPLTFVAQALENTDKRINNGKPVTPAFLFAVMLWEPVRLLAQSLQEQGMNELPALQAASHEVITDHVKYTAVPRRFSVGVREIWQLQRQFRHRAGKKPLHFLSNPRFRAAYDFLCLRVAAGEDLNEECEWWTRFQEVSSAEQRKMIHREPTRSRRRRRKTKTSRGNVPA